MFEITKSGSFEDQWHVEKIGSDGEVYTAIFTGPKSMERASEYAEIMNWLEHRSDVTAEA